MIVDPVPFPKRQILDSSKLKGFADDNFNCGGNGGIFSKKLENIVGKPLRAISISSFPTVFSKRRTADKLKQGLVWERVKIHYAYPPTEL